MVTNVTFVVTNIIKSVWKKNSYSDIGLNDAIFFICDKCEQNMFVQFLIFINTLYLVSKLKLAFCFMILIFYL